MLTKPRKLVQHSEGRAQRSNEIKIGGVPVLPLPLDVSRSQKVLRRRDRLPNPHDDRAGPGTVGRRRHNVDTRAHRREQLACDAADQRHRLCLQAGAPAVRVSRGGRVAVSKHDAQVDWRRDTRKAADC